jgi:hypothetical protein
LIEREYTRTYSEMMKHYLSNKNNENIVVGIAENIGNRLKMNWSILEDYE